MKYYIVAGESSGDLHSRHLMDAIRSLDAEAEIRYWYRPDMAYMGFFSVALHLPAILRGLRECRKDIAAFCPDRLVLVDYPGFNIRIASWFHTHIASYGNMSEAVRPRVVYYIPPKIWAWKEGRIAGLRRDVDTILSILPFEVRWYAERYGHRVCYVGNPTLDEIVAFRKMLQPGEIEEWKRTFAPGGEPVVALLPGSRRKEIERNLPLMLRAAKAVGGEYRYVIASAPNMDAGFYEDIISDVTGCSGFRERVVLAPCHGSRSSFLLLHNAFAALVTSGTATLETAISGVPQVVCYSMPCGRVVSLVRKFVLKVPYVSLVNLIVGREVVPELIAGDMTAENMEHGLRRLLCDGTLRKEQLQGYAVMMRLLGEPGAPAKAAGLVMSGRI
ncbi:MAG: lipid-A-disaccharide synthase [Bacteroidaceae bacterium]|nr:lipid-A-disaccharide synthase [Bacteroidaceae bacterium]